MSFDWIDFLQTYNIDYVTQGPNVAKGNVYIKCPMCGSDDPSHHMGIAIDGSGWACWRNQRHRGRSPVHLVALLARVSFARAAEIAHFESSVPGDLVSSVYELLSSDKRRSDDVRTLKLPTCFRAFKNTPTAALYIQYLHQRGFKRKHIFQFTDFYGMRYSAIGAFKARIIFPVYFEGKLVSWTGRTVYRDKNLVRYKTLTTKPDRAEAQNLQPAIDPISHHFLWFDDLMSGRDETLVLVEGPFDALKVRYLGQKYGVTSTCFFTSAPTKAQIDLLHDIVPRFENVYLVMDEGMHVSSMYIRDALASLNVFNLRLPSGYSDPGELDEKGLKRLLPCLK